MTQPSASSSDRPPAATDRRPASPPPHVVVVGSGFAGFHACRALERLLPAADITVISPTDYLLYSPLLPEVAAGVMDPRHIVVPLSQGLARTVPLLGFAVDTDLDAQLVQVLQPDGSTRQVGYDRLVLCPGSVTREFDVPGLDEHALGFKSLTEALYLRDHVLQQLELANTTADPAVRAARCTFVVVGAGYAGTEVLAQLQHLVGGLLGRYPHLVDDDVRWVLCDAAPVVLPELGADLGHRALAVLQRRGVQVHLDTQLRAIAGDAVTLADGSRIPTRTVVWTAGVSASPLIAAVADRHHLPLNAGRLTVTPHLAVPGHRGVWALGDAAAVPDLTHPGRLCPPTAQHAQRQAKRAASNVAASLGVGSQRPYRHHDLGLVVDLAGRDAVARPLHLPLHGLAAKAVTRGYHLMALPAADNRIRVATDWLLDAVLGRSAAQLSLIPPREAALPAAEHTDLYRHQVGTATSSSTHPSSRPRRPPYGSALAHPAGQAPAGTGEHR